MKLKYVSIKNYRSIKNIRIDFDTQCRVLVGINESGKSNILHALRLLDPGVKSTKKDIREALKGEKQIEEAYVRFIFTFEDDEVSEIYDAVSKKILTPDANTSIIKIKDKQWGLKDYCQAKEGLYIQNVLKTNKHYSVWMVSDAKILAGWKKILENCPDNYIVKDIKGNSYSLKNFTIVDSNQIPGIPKEYLADASAEEISSIIDESIKITMKNYHPEVLFWNYDENQLLPSKINLEKFCENPENFVPLKMMFNLNEIWKIKEEIENAKSGSANTLKNLLGRIADKTTRHFHETWAEYHDIKFSLTIDGEDINATIEDKSNHYELSQRSDGFKRFITFLLLVSARSKTNLFADSLLLIDEPEVGLHPSGCRYLRDELIKISKENYVVFSTHSIFMIDNQVIKRHLIVKKENEITAVSEVTESNVQDEEVIYKSLGYSIFANLKEKNIIFEGWRDKKLFEVALSSVPSSYNTIKIPLKNAGHCFAQGVKDISSITPLFEAGERKCLIISDDDNAAKSKQKEYKAAKAYGVWKRYSEIDSLINAVTGEDFIKEKAFSKLIQGIKSKYTLPDSPSLSDPKGKIYSLKQWLLKNAISINDTDKEIKYIKDVLFENLKQSEIELEYYQFLTKVVSELENLK